MAEELEWFDKVVDDDTGGGEDRWTPLMWAAQRSNLEVLEELVAHGADVMKPKQDGITAFHLAASNNDV